MKKFDGKRVLELGTSVGSVDMVKYAQANGAYVIVSDYSDPARSAAKRIADKTYMVSTDDLDGLLDICKKEKVDAVMSGVSEAIIQTSRQIAERLNLPIYYTEDQWNRFMKKHCFRHICEKYRVSTPKTYFTGQIEAIGDVNAYDYPVIVKPVDASSNSGISICEEAAKMQYALEHASKHSRSRTVIVEQYIDGDEVSPTYVIHNHTAKLVCMGTKYPYINENGLRALSNAYVYPAASLDLFLENEDGNIRRMLVEEGLNNCTVFFQGMCKNGQFYIFEAGLRMEGTGSYRITSALNGQNFLEFMVDNALNAPTDYDLTKDDPYLGGKKCVIFSQIVKGGTIASVSGYDEIRQNAMIFSSEQRRYPGDTIENSGTLRQIMFRYLIFGDDMASVVSLIREIQRKVVALDNAGNNLLVTDFDPDCLMA